MSIPPCRDRNQDDEAYAWIGKITHRQHHGCISRRESGDRHAVCRTAGRGQTGLFRRLVRMHLGLGFSIDTERHTLVVFSSSANATPAFEGKGGDDLATEISNVLSMAYQTPNAIDLRQLCIIPSKKCWKMYVDILVGTIGRHNGV